MGNNSITAAYIKVSWTVTSDERDKTDVEDLDVGLDFVNKLTPVTYRWDQRSSYLTSDQNDLNDIVPDGTYKKDQLNLGFLAQDVEKIEEELGYKVSDKTNLTTSLTNDGKQYGLKYERFVPILVKAVQELSDQVTDLKDQLDKCNCD